MVVTNPYQVNLLVFVGINAVLAMSFVLVLRTGLVSMRVAAFWGMGAYSSTWMAMSLQWPVWLSMPAATLIAGVVGLAFGALVIRNPGFGFVIMTMIFGMLFVAVVGATEALGGYRGILRVPGPEPIGLPFLPPIVFGSPRSLYYLMLLIALFWVAVYSAMYESWTGRAWTAIELDSRLAASLGIDVYRYRVLAFVVAGLTVGMMGAFYAHYQNLLLPGTFDIFKTVNVQVYAILGGIQFPLLGPLVGAMVMVFFPECMRVAREVEPVITGLLLILLIVFLPSGLLSVPGVRSVAADPIGSVASLGRVFRAAPPALGARPKSRETADSEAPVAKPEGGGA